MKPWELFEYTFEQFLLALKGHELTQAAEWDRTRHIMLVIAKANGAKSINSVQDVMSIPLLDKKTDNRIRPNLLARLKQKQAQQDGGKDT